MNYSHWIECKDYSENSEMEPKEALAREFLFYAVTRIGRLLPPAERMQQTRLRKKPMYKKSMEVYAKHFANEVKEVTETLENPILIATTSVDFGVIAVVPAVLLIKDSIYIFDCQYYDINEDRLMLLGYGALRKFSIVNNIHTVHLHLIKPTNPTAHIKKEIKAHDLQSWFDKQRQTVTAGEWCNSCKEYKHCVTRIQNDVFTNLPKPETLTEQQIDQILSKDFNNWWGRIKEWKLKKTKTAEEPTTTQ